MKSSASRSDVVTPIRQAWNHAGQLLFRPFDLGRWLAIGFTAWLATLGQSWGGGGGTNFNSSSQSGNPATEIRDAFDQGREWISENLMWLIPVVVIGGLLLIAVWLVMLWLSSRGQFMFLHNVITGRDEVVDPWSRYSAHGNSLFVFRLVLALVGMVTAIPVLAVGGWAGVTAIQESGSAPAALVVVVLSGLTIFVIGIGFLVVGKLTADFVVPIMWKQTSSCRAAWGVFLRLAGSDPGAILLYLLFQILLWMAALFLILAVVLLTCCIAGCLLAIPYIGTVLLLPVLVFFRSYSLHFLAGFGSEWNLVVRQVEAPGGTTGTPG